jgi:membrane complex biogenesis BtpA family protein
VAARQATLFGEGRSLVGVIHVHALPGTPRARESIAAITSAAVAEAQVYARAGFDAVMIENMHDRPYLKRSVGPEIVAAMTAIGLAVRASVSLPLGLQILAGANRAALAVAHACGAAFVRGEGFVFAHVADEGLIESDAGELLRYRKAIGAEKVRVIADIKKKHSAHAITGDVDLAATAHAAEFFLADGLVVTGAATGLPADPAEVDAVARTVKLPVLVGSGITADNIADYASADGFIVGSWVKRGGDWSGALDSRKAAALVKAFRHLPPRPA